MQKLRIGFMVLGALVLGGAAVVAGCRASRSKREKKDELADSVSRNQAKYLKGETSGETSVSVKDAKCKKLRFKSFDGGGPEYTVTISDLGVATYSTKCDYGDQNAEEMTGTAYDVVVSVFPVAAGTTTMEVVGTSPIVEEERYYYQIDVDENLEITLTEVERPN